jgi:hypothetical protein
MKMITMRTTIVGASAAIVLVGCLAYAQPPLPELEILSVVSVAVTKISTWPLLADFVAKEALIFREKRRRRLS